MAPPQSTFSAAIVRLRHMISDLAPLRYHPVSRPYSSAADGKPDAAWTTWDLVRRSRERASRLPPFTHAASAIAQTELLADVALAVGLLAARVDSCVTAQVVLQPLGVVRVGDCKRELHGAFSCRACTLACTRREARYRVVGSQQDR